METITQEGIMGGTTKKHKWLTVDEFADLLRCSPRSVHRHIVKKKVKGLVCIKQPFGRKSRLLFRSDSVERYLGSLEKVSPRAYRPSLHG